jgi:hypothetical protein
MAIQLSVAVRNGRLDSFETVCGTSGTDMIVNSLDGNA